MNKSLVSVVVTSFNRPGLLKRAVGSVLAQTYPNTEIIIVDDASQMDVQKILSDFSTFRLKIMVNSTNLGLAVSRNRGWQSARGVYVAFLDDDDEWLPEKIEKQVGLFSRLSDKYGVVYCGREVVRFNGLGYYHRPKIKGNISLAIVTTGLSTIPSSCMFRRGVLQSIGGFDSGLRSSIDHDIWMNLASHQFLAHYIDAPLVRSYENLATRLTSDYQTRISNLNKYLTKWSEYLDQLFTPHQAEIYKLQYYNQVVSWLTFEQWKRGQFREGTVCLVSIKIRDARSFITWLKTLFCSVAWFLLRLCYEYLPVPKRFRLFSVS